LSDYAVDRMRASWSSFNAVYCIRGRPDLVLRVSKSRLCDAEKAMYLDEIALTNEMAALGLAPRVMGTAFVRIGKGAVRIPRSGERDVHVGMFMEKYDLSLCSVQADETLTAELFLHFPGEEAVAALYRCASVHMGCADAKPGNVVARRTAGGISLALIDFDMRFCARAPRFAAPAERRAPHGALGALNEALDAFGKGDVRDIVTLRSALMLFVFCFVAAWQAELDSTTKGGFYIFPYPRLAEILARHASSIFVLVVLEESNNRMYNLVPATEGDSQCTVRGVISAYSDHQHTVQTAMDLIVRAAASAPSRLLRACVDGDKRYPEAYCSGMLSLATGVPLPIDMSDEAIRSWAAQAPVSDAFVTL
jgi:hypothetical protein